MPITPSQRPVWASILLALLGGLIAGALAKFADEAPIPAAGMITTYFGVWVVTVTVIAAWSHSRVRAIVCAVAFLAAMVTAYYGVQRYLFGFFSPGLFLAWAAAALLLAPPFAALVWPARQEGWYAAFGAALPIGFLLYEAYSVRFLLNVNADYPALFGFDILCALALLLVLAKSGKQRLRVLLLTPIVFLAFYVGFTALLPIILGALR
jgi:hypothetical protein